MTKLDQKCSSLVAACVSFIGVIVAIPRHAVAAPASPPPMKLMTLNGFNPDDYGFDANGRAFLYHNNNDGAGPDPFGKVTRGTGKNGGDELDEYKDGSITVLRHCNCGPQDTQVCGVLPDGRVLLNVMVYAGWSEGPRSNDARMNALVPNNCHLTDGNVQMCLHDGSDNSHPGGVNNDIRDALTAFFGIDSQTPSRYDPQGYVSRTAPVWFYVLCSPQDGRLSIVTKPVSSTVPIRSGHQNGRDYGAGCLRVNGQTPIFQRPFVATNNVGDMLFEDGCLMHDGSWVQLPDTNQQHLTATAINNKGDIVGVTEDSTDSSPLRSKQAFLYSSGALKLLGTLGSLWSVPVAISDDGMIVGDSFRSDNTKHAFAYYDNMIHDLIPNDNRESCIVGINAKGIIAGNMMTASGARGFVWKQNNVQIIGAIPGCNSFALRIDNDDVVEVECCQSDWPDLADNVYSTDLHVDDSRSIPHAVLPRPITSDPALVLSRRKIMEVGMCSGNSATSHDYACVWSNGKLITLDSRVMRFPDPWHFNSILGRSSSGDMLLVVTKESSRDEDSLRFLYIAKRNP